MPNVPLLTGEHVRAAVSPSEAVDVVRDAFLAYARGDWTMPPKTYVEAYPAGDFRAMPALGGGYALLKWVTSFPGNPARGLPTVTGLVLLSSAEDGSLARGARHGRGDRPRTGAAAVLAAEVLGGPDAGPAAVVGAGVNGRAAARDLCRPRPRRGAVGRRRRPGRRRGRRDRGDRRGQPRGGARRGRGRDRHARARPAVPRGQPAAGPARQPDGRRRSGQGRDRPRGAGPRGARRLVVDEWEQASHGGDTSHAVERGLLGREAVATLGGIIAGEEQGRRSDADITVFDSTGLAIQDLAVAIAAYRGSRLATCRTLRCSRCSAPRSRSPD